MSTIPNKLSWHRGHLIAYDWKQEMLVYVETGKQVQYRNAEVCATCNLAPIPATNKECGPWADACLGILAGVKAACCGHGIEPGYIFYLNGNHIVLPTIGA